MGCYILVNNIILGRTAKLSMISLEENSKKLEELKKKINDVRGSL